MPINRYKQMLASIPTGSFYASDGQVIPYRGVGTTAEYSIRLNTKYASHEYGVYINDKFQFTTTSDINGVVTISVNLVRGNNIIKLIPNGIDESVSTTITTRDYATMLAATSEIVENSDTDIEQILAESRLATSSASLIEQVFGKPVDTLNLFEYDLETYREILQELRVAYRHYGLTLDGLNRVVRAFTHINPLYYKRQFGPTWKLRSDFITDITDVSRATVQCGDISWTSGPAVDLTINSISDDVGFVGKIYLLAWKDILTNICYVRYRATSTGFGPTVAVTSGMGRPQKMRSPNTYTLYDAPIVPSMVGELGPYDIRYDANDLLNLEFGGRGIVSIRLTPGATRTPAGIAAEINAAMSADTRYGVDYSAVASVLTSLGGDRIKIVTSNSGATVESITIHPVTSYTLNDSGDAAQSLFNLAPIRSGLGVDALACADTITLDPNTDMATWPDLSTGDSPINLLIGRTTYQLVGSTQSQTTVIDPQIVEAISINKTTRVVTLGTPLPNDYYVGASVEVVGQLPYTINPVTNVRPLSITVNDTSAFITSGSSGEVQLLGTGIPDGWRQSSVPPASAEPLNISYFDTDYDLPILIDGTQTYTYIPVSDRILDYKGFMLEFGVWASPSSYVNSTSTDISSLAFSFDGGSTWSSSAPTITGESISSINKPKLYSYRAIIPSTATKCIARIGVSAGTLPLALHRVRCTIPNINAGLFLGDGTIPRNESRIKTGGFMYVWSVDALTQQESDAIGTSSVTNVVKGHIDKILPAKSWVDKFDVSEYSGPSCVNVVGAIKSAELANGTATNLELVLRSPSRFSYLKPSVVSRQSETVTWDNSLLFDVSVDSTQLDAVIYEDGIPLPKTDWRWNSSTEIEKLSPNNRYSTYIIEYYALLSYETGALDLGAIYADYIWYADYSALLRPEVSFNKLPQTVPVQFDGNGIAKLSDPYDGESTTTLVVDDGSSQSIVSRSLWSFTSDTEISINTDSLNTNALYTLSYVALVPDPTSDVSIVAEIKSANTIGGLASAVYSTILPNQVVGSTYRYHKMRATIQNVRDVRDIRLQSLLLKGLNAFGSGGTIPLLRK